MIQRVEAFGAELDTLAFSDGKILEQRKIDVGDSGAADCVAALIAELPGLRGRVETPEGAAAHPLIRGVRSGVRIGNQIRTARIEAADLGRLALERYIGAVVDREGRSGGETTDAVELPPID